MVGSFWQETEGEIARALRKPCELHKKPEQDMDAKLQRNNEHTNLQGCAARSSPREQSSSEMVTTVTKGWSCEQVSSLWKPKGVSLCPHQLICTGRVPRLGTQHRRGSQQPGHDNSTKSRALAPLFEMFGFLYSSTSLCSQQPMFCRREAFVKHPTSYPQQELHLKSSRGTPGLRPPANLRKVRLGSPDISLLNTEKYPSSATAASKTLCRPACF